MVVHYNNALNPEEFRYPICGMRISDSSFQHTTDKEGVTCARCRKSLGLEPLWLNGNLWAGNSEGQANENDTLDKLDKVTSSQLAKILFVNVSTISRWAKLPEWPEPLTRQGKGGEKVWKVSDLPKNIVLRGKPVPIQAPVLDYFGKQFWREVGKYGDEEISTEAAEIHGHVPRLPRPNAYLPDRGQLSPAELHHGPGNSRFSASRMGDISNADGVRKACQAHVQSSELAAPERKDRDSAAAGLSDPSLPRQCSGLDRPQNGRLRAGALSAISGLPNSLEEDRSLSVRPGAEAQSQQAIPNPQDGRHLAVILQPFYGHLVH
jgi:hypothetical protein